MARKEAIASIAKVVDAVYSAGLMCILLGDFNSSRSQLKKALTKQHCAPLHIANVTGNTFYSSIGVSTIDHILYEYGTNCFSSYNSSATLREVEILNGWPISDHLPILSSWELNGEVEIPRTRYRISHEVCTANPKAIAFHARWKAMEKDVNLDQLAEGFRDAVTSVAEDLKAVKSIGRTDSTPRPSKRLCKSIVEKNGAFLAWSKDRSNSELWDHYGNLRAVVRKDIRSEQRARKDKWVSQKIAELTSADARTKWSSI